MQMSSEKLQSQEKAQAGGFHENRVFWVSSFDLSCLACLPLPVSPRQSVSQSGCQPDVLQHLWRRMRAM